MPPVQRRKQALLARLRRRAEVSPSRDRRRAEQNNRREPRYGHFAVESFQQALAKLDAWRAKQGDCS
jgi:hypothetical protein